MNFYIFATEPDFEFDYNQIDSDERCDIVKSNRGHRSHQCTDWMSTKKEPHIISYKDEDQNAMAVCDFELPGWVYHNLAKIILRKQVYLLF